MFSPQKSLFLFTQNPIFIHTELFFSHTDLTDLTEIFFSLTDLTDPTDFNLPCGMIILTQRRRERRGSAENYRPVGSAEIAEIAEI